MLFKMLQYEILIFLTLFEQSLISTQLLKAHHFACYCCSKQKNRSDSILTNV